MNTTISLKELTQRYTTDEIFCEATRKFTLFHEDAVSLIDLIQKIRNSPDDESSDMNIVPMVAFLKKGQKPALFSYGGFRKNNRNYRFTAKNCYSIAKISCCNVQIINQTEFSEHPFVSEYLPQTELELLTIILLSLNAFSTEIVDCYFGGEAKNADSITYIGELIKNNNSPINNL